VVKIKSVQSLEILGSPHPSVTQFVTGQNAHVNVKRLIGCKKRQIYETKNKNTNYVKSCCCKPKIAVEQWFGPLEDHSRISDTNKNNLLEQSRSARRQLFLL